MLFVHRVQPFQPDPVCVCVYVLRMNGIILPILMAHICLMCFESVADEVPETKEA